MKSNFTQYKSYYAIAFHCSAWILFIFLPEFLNEMPFNQTFFFQRLIMTFVYIGLFYLNYFYITPKFLKQDKLLFFVFFIFSGLLLMFLVDKSTMSLIKNDMPMKPFNNFYKEKSHDFDGMLIFRNVTTGIIIFSISTLLRLYQIWINKEQAYEKSEKEKVKSELSFLKLQINPHFLFNSLNSIYSLAVNQSEKTAEVVLKLSDLMRYMIYTASEKLVPIENEISHIQDYIELQKLRLFDVVKIQFETASIPQGFYIEPMLLIPFVENAFKHGISYAAKSEISIYVLIKNGFLVFRTVNTIFETIPEFPDNSGLGLNNVKRRLELLYAENYELEIDTKRNIFTVYLKIKLKTSE